MLVKKLPVLRPRTSIDDEVTEFGTLTMSVLLCVGTPVIVEFVTKLDEKFKERQPENVRLSKVVTFLRDTSAPTIDRPEKLHEHSALALG